MVKEGFTEEVIIKAIEANKSDFDTSLPGLRTLKNAGLNEKIINAMLSAGSRKPEAPTAAAAAKGLPEEIGVYLKEGEKLTEIQPEIVNLRSGGFLKSIATSGLSGGHINGTVKNPHSALKTGLPIEFIIRCPEGKSITEYQLLRLDEKKDRRSGPRSICIVAEVRAADVRSSHKFEEEIGAASSENGLFIAKMEFSVRTGLTSRRSTNSRAIDRYHHKDRPDDWDMILLLGYPNYAALDQEANVTAGCGKHFGSSEAAAAKKRAEFREALATRL